MSIHDDCKNLVNAIHLLMLEIDRSELETKEQEYDQLFIMLERLQINLARLPANEAAAFGQDNIKIRNLLQEWSCGLQIKSNELAHLITTLNLQQHAQNKYLQNADLKV